MALLHSGNLQCAFVLPISEPVLALNSLRNSDDLESLSLLPLFPAEITGVNCHVWFVSVLRIEPRVLCTLGKHSTTEIRSQSRAAGTAGNTQTLGAQTQFPKLRSDTATVPFSAATVSCAEVYPQSSGLSVSCT